jgi:hypothetical protein
MQASIAAARLRLQQTESGNESGSHRIEKCQAVYRRDAIRELSSFLGVSIHVIAVSRYTGLERRDKA